MNKIPCSFCGDSEAPQVQSPTIKFRIAAICYKCVERLKGDLLRPPKIMTE